MPKQKKKRNQSKTTKSKTKEIVRDKKGRIVEGVPQKTNKNGTAGRPTKYKESYCNKLINFFLDAEKGELRKEVIEEHFHENGTTKWVKYKLIPEYNLPFFSEFAQLIGVKSDTVRDWAEVRDEEGKLKYPEFSGAYKEAKEIQKRILIKNGLSGAWNPGYNIFVSKNLTDMTDQSEQKVTNVNISLIALCDQAKARIKKQREQIDSGAKVEVVG